MPTYVFQCKTCNERFERFLKMADPPMRKCPDCGGAVRKVMFPPAIAFKGPGFYVNDYKKPNPAATVPTDKPADTATPAKPPEKTPALVPAAAPAS